MSKMQEQIRTTGAAWAQMGNISIPVPILDFYPQFACPRPSIFLYDDDESTRLFHHNSTANLRLPDSYQRGLSLIQVFALLRCFVYELWSEICRQEARLDGL